MKKLRKIEKMNKERMKIRNCRLKQDFFFAFHFQHMTETFKGSPKMEISTGKNLRSGKNREK